MLLCMMVCYVVLWMQRSSRRWPVTMASAELVRDGMAMPRVRSQRATTCDCAPSRFACAIGFDETSEKSIAMRAVGVAPPDVSTARMAAPLYVVLEAWKQMSSMSRGRDGVQALAIWIASATGRPSSTYLCAQPRESSGSGEGEGQG